MTADTNLRNKAFDVGHKDVIDKIEDGLNGTIKNITDNPDGSITVEKGTSDISTGVTNLKITTDLKKVNSAPFKVGVDGSVSFTFPQNTEASEVSFQVPYFTVDNKGRVTSSTNRTVTINRASYSNYNNYANYTSYNNYANYSSYYNYSNYYNYGNYTNYGSYGSYTQYSNYSEYSSYHQYSSYGNTD